MASLLRIITFISALVATGFALSCIECTAPSVTACSGESVMCPYGFLCGSMYVGTIVDGKYQSTFLRSCLPREECDFKGNLSMGLEQIGSASTCCNTNDCTAAIPTVISSNNQPNGLECPSCSSVNSIYCDSTETIKCTGNLNKCIFKTEDISAGESPSVSSVRGCATKSFCDRGNFSFSDEISTTKVTVYCYGGGISVQKILLTPTIAGLLLFRWII
ncbi:phospholipase A2 inhibitor and Ly6/PLAUR domain-containing protein-like [Engystomops pustulosus]|uniref:phospholipase A2 inhibitor and Ly6/PLAUR domain-containing protein-like n=1 Tax=Engystomops pustulosus TaxID=76066 RepID=UPI003AFA345B